MNSKGETDWIGLIILAILLAGAVCVSYWLITREISQCGKDPIYYAIDEWLDFGEDAELVKNFSHVRFIIYLDEFEEFPIFDKKLFNPARPPTPPKYNYTYKEVNLTERLLPLE